MHKKIHVKTKNKICAAVLVFVLAGSLTAGACAVPNVYAKTEAEKKRDAYKKKLKAKNSDIANIKDSQSDVKDSITAAAARMPPACRGACGPGRGAWDCGPGLPLNFAPRLTAAL